MPVDFYLEQFACTEYGRGSGQGQFIFTASEASGRSSERGAKRSASVSVLKDYIASVTNNRSPLNSAMIEYLFLLLFYLLLFFSLLLSFLDDGESCRSPYKSLYSAFLFCISTLGRKPPYIHYHALCTRIVQSTNQSPNVGHVAGILLSKNRWVENRLTCRL